MLWFCFQDWRAVLRRRESVFQLPVSCWTLHHREENLHVSLTLKHEYVLKKWFKQLFKFTLGWKGKFLWQLYWLKVYSNVTHLCLSLCFHRCCFFFVFFTQLFLYIFLSLCSHEYISGYYRVSVYFLCKILSDIITLRTIPAIVFTCVAYFMVGKWKTSCALLVFML